MKSQISPRVSVAVLALILTAFSVALGVLFPQVVADFVNAGKVLLWFAGFLVLWVGFPAIVAYMLTFFLPKEASLRSKAILVFVTGCICGIASVIFSIMMAFPFLLRWAQAEIPSDFPVVLTFFMGFAIAVWFTANKVKRQ